MNKKTHLECGNLAVGLNAKSPAEQEQVLSVEFLPIYVLQLDRQLDLVKDRTGHF